MKSFVTYCILFVFSISLVGQISPGDLSKAHTHLEGIRNCTSCHVLGEKVTSEKCLDCHKEIAARMHENKGYHASVEVKNKECAECHNEHHGLDFDIIELNKEGFDHNLSGYKLEGAHASQKCEACHRKKFIKDEKIKKKNFTFLGLEQSCLSCHQDVHRETLSNQCRNCHGMDHFAPATGFNHAQADFVLKGKHTNVACIQCHKKEMVEGNIFQHFSNVDHQNCTSCHEDVHKNKFGQDCAKCHSEESFHQIKDLNHFDHLSTGYPLLGMHQKVDCESCHGNNYTRPLKHEQCNNCHSDYHQKEFTGNNKYPDCAKCHSVDGFSQTLFSIEMHQQSDFKLEGAHMATPCFQCHKKEDRWHFKNTGNSCVDCHTNEHEHAMQANYTDKGCSNCHDVYDWQTVHFDHEITGYLLEGKHSETACGNCHYQEDESGLRIQKFAGIKQTCTECHPDEHLSQFEKYGENGCTNCHTYTNWLPDKFKHDTARFKLDGAHENLECFECHRKEHISKEEQRIKYIFEDISCASCHK